MKTIIRQQRTTTESMAKVANNIRSWAEQSACYLCDDIVQRNDSINFVNCRKVAHKSCIGIKAPIMGEILWSCENCGWPSVGDTTKQMSELSQKVQDLQQVPEKLIQMHAEIKQLKPKYSSFSQKSTVPQSVTNSISETSQKPLFNLDPEIKGTFNQEHGFGRDGYDSNNSVKRPKPNDWDDIGQGDCIAKSNRPNRIENIGTRASSNDFNGVRRKQSRRQIYLGRLNTNGTEELIKNWCAKNGAELLHLREISREGSKLRSYHLVFPESSSDIIERSDFWPKNVVHGGYYLNDEARN